MFIIIMIFQMRFNRLQSLFISMEICIVAMDFVVTLLVPDEGVMSVNYQSFVM